MARHRYRSHPRSVPEPARRPAWQHVLTGFAIGMVALLAALPLQARAQDAEPVDPQARAEWWAALEACDARDKPACDKAVTLAGQLFERLDRNVATTWLKACLQGDMDRCEIGYRRFKRTGFTERDRPVSHLFARMSCFGGMPDLCRPWDDFDTVDEGKRALVAADLCLQGARPNTCWYAMRHFKHRKGYFNVITYDLAETLCERYKSGAACNSWAEALEANWDHRRAWKWFRHACAKGLQASCPEAARLQKRVDYENRQEQARMEAELRRQAAQRQASSWRAQANSAGYSSTGSYRSPATPFGSSQRARQNWDRYNENLRCGNPTARGC